MNKMTDIALSVPPAQIPHKTARRRAREFALQGLYEWLVTQHDSQTIDQFLQKNPLFKKIDQQHYEVILHGAIQYAHTLSTQLQICLDRPLKELSLVERAALLVGAYELAHHTEIPYKVVINEAIEIAKTFGGQQGYRFVNGVLDKFAKKIRDAEKHT